MRISTCFIFLILASIAWSCSTPEPDPLPDPDPEASISLDELEDKKEYTEGMIVDSRLLGEERISLIMVNETQYPAPISLDLTQPGYYHLEIGTSPSQDSSPHVIRLVVLDPERGTAEWGLAPWTPQGLVFSETDSHTDLHYPAAVPQGQLMPLIVTLGGQLGASLDNAEAVAASATFHLKRGVGSVWIPPGEWSSCPLQVGGQQHILHADTLSSEPHSLGGRLQSDTIIPSGSWVVIDQDLTIPKGVCLSIEQGAFISVDEGINIYNDGMLKILGSESQPVVMTCLDPEKYWGGIIGREPGNTLEASHGIFGRSGFHEGADYNWGHAQRQGLIYCEDGSVALDHCYMIDHIGQVFYTQSASLELENCLIQRCKTGGQLNNTQLRISNSVFTDFPDDRLVYRDNDNDGLYLVECTGLIENSVFMYASDDGLDSGSGGEGGNVEVRNTRFESVFHEGAALSGGNNGKSKIHRFSNCLFMDCGQGLELGFSSPEHQVYVDSCSFIGNGIGIRYGDNYGWENHGKLWVSNSSCLGNVSYDVWNMTRDDWIADTADMIFDNVWVSREHPMYPQLNLIE